MTLATGTRLGPYEIHSPIGAGGMGEVYKARDTRLGRTVAVKVLPTQLSQSVEVRERFEREAKTISSLSHSHICALYDVGREGEIDYLVMEFLEGETLSARLAKGALPTEQALRYGTEIADALDKAHRQGIVHRDLKPGNVMLTKSGVKLLDFGLAKAMPPSAPQSTLTALPTQAELTREGTILGTFQYMAPEQLEGKDADARTDIFGLGAVLYEMTTGRKAFSGATQASLISSILRDEPPPISQVASMTPPALDRVVRTCLAKDPEERWQSAGDVAKELRWIAEGSAAGVAAPAAVSSRRHNRERIAWVVAAAAVGDRGVARPSRGRARLRLRPRSSCGRTSCLPEKIRLNIAVISPDGGRVVFSGVDEAGKVQLWVRPLDAYTATPIAGTEGGILPFWSPDGRFIGFFADKKLKKIEASGGSPIVVYDVDGLGGAWGAGGDILFTGPSGPVFRLPPSGGKALPVTKLDEKLHETAHRYPFFLPDGKALSLHGAEPRGQLPGSRQSHLGRLARRRAGEAARPGELQRPVRQRLSALRAGRRFQRDPARAAPGPDSGSRPPVSPSSSANRSASTATFLGYRRLHGLRRGNARLRRARSSRPGSSGSTGAASRLECSESPRPASSSASPRTARGSRSHRRTRVRKRPRSGSATSLAGSRRA